MADMTPERKAEIRAAAEAATDGPWENDVPGCVGITYPQGGKATICTCPVADIKRNGDNDAAFIALSRTAIPELLSKIERLSAALADTVKAWEALPMGHHSVRDVQNWLSHTMKPAIDRARAALTDTQ